MKHHGDRTQQVLQYLQTDIVLSLLKQLETHALDTYLVRDLEKNRLGVIKRADTTSKKAQEHLINEVIALKALKGQGVPNVYETGQRNYELNRYEYVVIEYIGSLRI